MEQFALEVTEPVKYHNNTWPSAAQHTVHELTPGLYPLTQSNNSSSLETRVDNTLVSDTYHGVQSRYFEPGPNKLYLMVWKWEAKDGEDLVLNGTKLGTFRKISAES